mmetsp:Transcript_139616/g.197703  ORF Transcript_139616/g.197703 Transcript_139616/m.197703 type:complete len:206 (+) Transcript_139616:705-1322(+)
MVHHLLFGELGDRWQHTEGVAGQQDHVAWVAVDLCRDQRIGDVVQGVCTPCVLREGHVVIVNFSAPLIEDHVLQHTAEANGIVDLWFLLPREVDALGVAAALDVEDALGSPDMFVVPNQLSRRVRAESRLPCATKPEEQGHISLRAHIAGRVQWQRPFCGAQMPLRSQRHVIHHHREDSLLHLPRVLRAKDHHLSPAERQGHGSG